MSLDQSTRISRAASDRASGRRGVALPADAATLAPEDIQALHDLADRATQQLNARGVPPDEAVIGIYRQFSRSSRIAARILTTLLGPAACHTLTVASPRHPRGAQSGDPVPDLVRPERMHLVIDVSRLPHPQARTIAEAAGTPLISRSFPTMQQERGDRSDHAAVDQGTATGRALALSRSGITAHVSSVVSRSAVTARAR
jgi:hypothetical protein